MKIKRENSKRYEFGALNQGDVFEYDDSVYIKTELKRGENGLDANAINVVLGTWMYFEHTVRTNLLNAELVIIE